MAKELKKENKKICWTGGYSDLFFAPTEDGAMVLLNYEYDYEEIHRRCGGELTYCSMSGNNGEGYIERLADLISVGLYRIDTAKNEWQYEKEVAPGITVMMPFVSHNGNSHWLGHWEGGSMKTALENYPVVIKADEGRTLIYCSFGRNMDKVLKVLLSGGSFDRQPQLLKRTFAKDGVEEVVEVKFYNFFGRSYYPWEFEGNLLEKYQVCPSCERVHDIFHIVEKDGKYYGTSRIAGTTYATKCFAEDPCEQMTDAPRGWECLDTNMMYKLRENEVFIVGWQDYKSAFEKVAKRVARFFSGADEQALMEYLAEHMPTSKYAEYELKVNKLLFLLDKEAQMAEVRKGIAKKVRQDVMDLARQFVNEFNDKALVEAIPDEFVVKFEDSLESGNCLPGTQAFVDQYFPGLTQCIAGALKELADNWNVMRVLKYIAIREGFVGKAKRIAVPEE